jgi:hypothetical protein
MTVRPAGIRDLAGLQGRLKGGVCASARRSLSPNWPMRDAEAFRDHWQHLDFAPLDLVRRRSWTSAGALAAIGEFRSELTKRRSLLLTTLFSPDQVLERLLCDLEGRDFPLADSWIGLLWLAVAARDATGGDLPADGGFAALDAELLRPLATRLVFLVASEPMRSRRTKNAWWADADLTSSGSGTLARALGPDSWHEVAARCQRERREWLACLSGYESHPFLALARPAEFETELRALVFRHGRRGFPLPVSVKPLEDPARLTAEDKVVIDEVTDRHFLPRFDLLSTLALALCDDRRAWFHGRIAVAGLAVAAALAAAVRAGMLLIHPATMLASVCLAIVGAGIVVFGRGWAAPWLLRFPAAAAVGVIALISLSPGGWVAAPPGGWLAVAVLSGAAVGYLVVEGRNHGLARGALVWRSLAVATVGAMYSLIVALIGLVWVAPAFIQNARVITALWHHPNYGHAGLALCLAASWCLAVGVFSQILWDDRPITAPLAHLSWRSR